MDDKGQAEIIGLFVEFVVLFFVLLAVGPVIHEAANSIMPLGVILQFIFPGPEDAAIGLIKALIDTGLITAITGAGMGHR